MAKSKQVPAKMDTRKKVALWALIAPTAFIALVFFLYAITNWALEAAGLLNSNALAVTINILLALLGIVGVIAWLPGIITGIILLKIKK